VGGGRRSGDHRVHRRIRRRGRVRRAGRARGTSRWGSQLGAHRGGARPAGRYQPSHGQGPLPRSGRRGGGVMTPAVQAAPPARRRNRRGEGDRLREEIITAASQMIGEAGDDTALTLRGVARRVGIAAPSIYRHFTDVDELKMAVVRRAFAEFAPARAAAGGDGAAPAARLLARGRAYIGFALANPGPYRYLFSQHAPTGDPERPPVDLPVFQALAESISRCQQAGLARAGDDPQWLAAQVWAALHGLVLLRLNAPGFPRPRPLEHTAGQAGARPHPPCPPGVRAPGRPAPPRRTAMNSTPATRQRPRATTLAGLAAAALVSAVIPAAAGLAFLISLVARRPLVAVAA